MQTTGIDIIFTLLKLISGVTALWDSCMKVWDSWKRLWPHIEGTCMIVYKYLTLSVLFIMK